MDSLNAELLDYCASSSPTMHVIDVTDLDLGWTTAERNNAHRRRDFAAAKREFTLHWHYDRCEYCDEVHPDTMEWRNVHRLLEAGVAWSSVYEAMDIARYCESADRTFEGFHDQALARDYDVRWLDFERMVLARDAELLQLRLAMRPDELGAPTHTIIH